MKHQGLVIALIAGVIATLLLFVLLTLPAQTARAAQGNLPPRPTPGAESGGDAGLAGVASIELRVRFSRVEQARRWQELWTVVQWQDALGGWHDVEGWRGPLDEMVNGEGRRVCWVLDKDFGTGPFRWTVYRSRSGRLLGYSESFHLPRDAGQTVAVTVTVSFRR